MGEPAAGIYSINVTKSLPFHARRQAASARFHYAFRAWPLEQPQTTPEKDVKPVPPFPPKTFHRIRPTNPRARDEMIAKRTTDIVSADLARKFKKGDGLVVASWDGFGPAEVEALGVVVNVSSGQREVEWMRVQFDLPRSDRGGGPFWKQPTFQFAETVAEDFRLKQFFSRYHSDPLAASRGSAP